MTNRWISAAWATLVAAGCLAGCSQQPQVTSVQSANVTIDHSTTRVPSVSCNQYQWMWMIDVGDQVHGAEAAVELTGNRATAKWVKFHDFDGFTGSAWQGGVGNAIATVAGDTYTFTGDVFGYGPANPNKPGTTSFKIVAYC
ncbi:MAG: lipoprotein LpqH [Mycobacteriaceae bacterium]|nr:lipoprotein LpqH [Mycobacteriaceae bacterium]MBV9638486.1 lipoprotein LpqH [Mycobacteriaceae bacterium]